MASDASPQALSPLVGKDVEYCVLPINAPRSAPRTTAITVYQSTPALHFGQQIANDSKYIYYAVGTGQIRVINKATACRSLIKAPAAGSKPSTGVIDMCTPNPSETMRIAAISPDKSFCIWEISETIFNEVPADNKIEAKLLLRVSLPQESATTFRRLLFHPTNDGAIFTATSDGEIWAWNLEELLAQATSAVEIECPADSKTDIHGRMCIEGSLGSVVTDMSFSPADGRYLAVASMTGQVSLFDLGTMARIREFSPFGNTNAIFSVSFPQDAAIDLDSSPLLVVVGGVRNSHFKLFEVTGNNESVAELQSIRLVPLSDHSSDAIACIAKYDMVTNTLLAASIRSPLLFSLHFDKVSSSFDSIMEYKTAQTTLSFAARGRVPPVAKNPLAAAPSTPAAILNSFTLQPTGVVLFALKPNPPVAAPVAPVVAVEQPKPLSLFEQMMKEEQERQEQLDRAAAEAQAQQAAAAAAEAQAQQAAAAAAAAAAEAERQRKVEEQNRAAAAAAPAAPSIPIVQDLFQAAAKQKKPNTRTASRSPVRRDVDMSALEAKLESVAERLFARFDEERRQREAEEAERQRRLLSTLSACVQKDLPDVIEKAISFAVRDKLMPELETLVSSLVSSPLASIEKASSSIQQASSSLPVAVRSSFTEQLVPSIEKAVSSMFAQINATLANSLQSSLAAPVSSLVADARSSLLSAESVSAIRSLSSATSAAAALPEAITRVEQAVSNGMTSLNAVIAKQGQETRDLLSKAAAAVPQAAVAAPSATPASPPVAKKSQRQPSPPVAPAAASSSSADAVVAPLSPVPVPAPKSSPVSAQDKVKAQLDELDFEAAFTDVLGSQDLALVTWLCKTVSLPRLVLAPFSSKGRTSTPISQPVIFACLQQLAFDLNTETKLKLSWLKDLIPAVDNKDSVIAPHIPDILGQVRSNLMNLQSQQPDQARLIESLLALVAQKLE